MCQSGYMREIGFLRLSNDAKDEVLSDSEGGRWAALFLLEKTGWLAGVSW
jgi:hypothetical protein